MKPTTTQLGSIILALAALSAAARGGDDDHKDKPQRPPKSKKYVDSKKLQKLINLDDLLAGSQVLQDLADAHGGNRAFGSGGHNATVDYLYETLSALDYYDVVKQPFTEIYAEGEATLSVDGAEVHADVLTYTPAGAAEAAALVPVANLGCEAGDFPAEVEGSVAFILRGNCTFALKALNAKAAGAVGAIVHNNEPGALAGTLGEPFADYAPVMGLSQEDAAPILEALEAGDVTVDFDIVATVEERTNFNVIAETKGGDHDNVLVLGGHTDSVSAGPGINDDGSGTIGCLNVAIALSNFKVKNAVRFGFWGAEEFGLLGSYHYMRSVNSSATELAKMRAYLNFDMIASPNYIYGIYDGDGGAFNLTGPAGSDVIERDFEEYFEDLDLASVPTEFSGRSDYAAFIENGVPSGGLFTGAESLKTAEEVELFGGEADVAYDVNYHQAGDDINNLNHDAYLVNAKSIANSVAKYALSFETLPEVTLERRGWTVDRGNFGKRSVSRGHGHAGHSHSGPCGGGSKE